MTALSPAKHRGGTARLPTSRRSIAARAFRYLGALAVLATGVAHIEQYAVDNYSTVPTIGTLFLLNFIAAVVIAVGLIAPLGRYTDSVRAIIAVGGIGLAVLSLAALFVSESSGSSVTEGIVSAVGRSVPETDSVTLSSVIQTSAAINPGNSGGALVDLSGQVIGIPTLSAIDPEMGTEAPGIGFAIASNTVRRTAIRLATSKTRRGVGRP